MTQSTDGRIRGFCEAKGWRFKPWEVHPADVDEGPCPWPASTAGAASWPKAQKLRAEILAALGNGALTH